MYSINSLICRASDYSTLWGGPPGRHLNLGRGRSKENLHTTIINIISYLVSLPAASQMRMVWSLEQLASREPSRDTRTIRTQSLHTTQGFSIVLVSSVADHLIRILKKNRCGSGSRPNFDTDPGKNYKDPNLGKKKGFSTRKFIKIWLKNRPFSKMHYRYRMCLYCIDELQLCFYKNHAN